MARSRFGSRRLRYLKARLSIFTRPAFLVAAVFLSVVGFVVKEYWTNPDFFELSQIQDSLSSTSSQSSNSQSSLSDEDRAIAADIDNLSVLDYDKEQANIPPIPTTSINDNSKIQKQNEAQLNKILDLTKKNQKEQRIPANTGQLKTPNTPSASQKNPFLKQADDLLKFNVDMGNSNGSTNNLSPFSSNSQTSTGSFNLGINNNSFANPNQTTNSPSALQKAITESTKNKENQEKATENSATEKNNF